MVLEGAVKEATRHQAEGATVQLTKNRHRSIPLLDTRRHGNRKEEVGGTGLKTGEGRSVGRYLPFFFCCCIFSFPFCVFFHSVFSFSGHFSVSLVFSFARWVGRPSRCVVIGRPPVAMATPIRLEGCNVSGWKIQWLTRVIMANFRRMSLKQRFQTENVNENFVEKMSSYIPVPSFSRLRCCQIIISLI